MGSFLLVAFGIIIKSLGDMALEFYQSRPRRANIERDYFNPCSHCKMKGMSKIGWRERTEEEIDKLAARASAIMRKRMAA